MTTQKQKIQTTSLNSEYSCVPAPVDADSIAKQSASYHIEPTNDLIADRVPSEPKVADD
jgi:hypothetical protein